MVNINEPELSRLAKEKDFEYKRITMGEEAAQQMA